MRHFGILAASAAMLFLASACQRDKDFTVPAFLHIDGITTYIPDTDAPSRDSGYYRADIVAAYVVAHYPGWSHVDTIGLFRLPFTTPILYNGPADQLTIYPAVEQSGISGALPFYTFYNPIRHTGDTLKAGDTLNLGTLQTTYNPLTDTALLYEPFERPSDHIRFDDNLTWVENDPANACNGNGYGLLRVADSVSTATFYASGTFAVRDPAKILYLELDIRNDLPLQVYMQAPYTTGGSEDRLPVMVINPIGHWQHLYINLGRTWTYFNHSQTFRLFFTAINADGTGGDIRIDNVKVLTTSVTL